MIEYPYFMRARILSRSKGHNALAAASYRAGQRLEEREVDTRSLTDHFQDQDQKTPQAQGGLVHDYRRRGGVMSSFIVMPKDAPSWMARRENLWNAVEASEKRIDAQLAREVIVSLPDVDLFDHLKPENKAKRLREFYEGFLRTYVNDNFVREGMIADVALHMPAEKNDARHFHAHIMLTTRLVNAEGFGRKERSWNAPEKLEGWRQNWSALVNDSLRAKGVAGFIDHRSYEERGLDIQATKPLGPKYSKLEHFGIKTQAGNDNRKAREQNRAGHKYLEKVFEHAPLASEEQIMSALTREGFAVPEEIKGQLEEEGIIIPLFSKETGQRSRLYSYKPMQERADKLKAQARRLYQRNDFSLPGELVKEAVKARGDKLVREALSYTASPQGFKVIEAADNGHKKTYMSSVRDLYEKAGYDIVSVARNNQGKAVFKRAGFTKGILTYRDFLRRFGARYTGERAKKKKVIIVDEADQYSPLQDQEIFNTAQKIGAKLIYIGTPGAKKKRNWQNLFAWYKMMSAFRTLRHKFLKTGKSSRFDLIRAAFLKANTLSALKMQGARYLHRFDNAALTKQAVLKAWFRGMRKKDGKRFILTARDKDAALFNAAIQKERLRRKHLKEKRGRVFMVSYMSDQGAALWQDLSVYSGDMIQFKKSYRDKGIEEGTRARVLIHYCDRSVLELDDGRIVEVDLKAHNGFDLGYAGRLVSNTDHELEESYIHHSSTHGLDDAPLLYQKTARPVHVFYSKQQAHDVQDLASQLLGRRHNLLEGFAAISGPKGGNDNVEIEEDENIEGDPADGWNKENGLG